MVKLCIILAIVAIAKAAPSANVQFQAAAAVEGDGFKPPISIDAGNVGVNFAGYHASAGLGGLLTGDPAMGGLHAEAGTPFGQEAGAGLGGTVDASGKAGGALYAGAAAGVGVGAAAGIAGSQYASAGGGEYGHKTFHQEAQVISEKAFQSPPKVIAEHTYQEAPVVHRTVIEKTVIPQYVEKTIQVPSYVEKTIRVPTVVEHKVRVPASPQISEKTYNEEGVGVGVGVQKQVYIAPPQVAAFDANFNSGAQVGAGFGVQKVKFHRRRPVVVQKQLYAGPGLLGGLFGSFRGGAAGGYGGQAVGTGAVAGANYSYKSNANPTFFNDIFNIPISALGAVNNLLNGIAGGAQAGGSVSFNKQVSVGGGAAASASAMSY